MEYGFFYITMAFILLLLVITACVKNIPAAAVITGLISIGYSTVFDVGLGDRLGMYYYISPSESTLYMLLGALLIYAPANVVYLSFLPERTGGMIIYTVGWIVGMTLLEYGCVLTGTLVFTGWRMFPWSPLTYIVSYLWLVLLYRYLEDKMRVVRATP